MIHIVFSPSMTFWRWILRNTSYVEKIDLGNNFTEYERKRSFTQFHVFKMGTLQDTHGFVIVPSFEDPELDVTNPDVLEDGAAHIRIRDMNSFISPSLQHKVTEKLIEFLSVTYAAHLFDATTGTMAINIDLSGLNMATMQDYERFKAFYLYGNDMRAYITASYVNIGSVADNIQKIELIFFEDAKHFDYKHSDGTPFTPYKPLFDVSNLYPYKPSTMRALGDIIREHGDVAFFMNIALSPGMITALQIMPRIGQNVIRAFNNVFINVTNMREYAGQKDAMFDILKLYRCAEELRQNNSFKLGHFEEIDGDHWGWIDYMDYMQIFRIRHILIKHIVGLLPDKRIERLRILHPEYQFPATYEPVYNSILPSVVGHDDVADQSLTFGNKVKYSRELFGVNKNIMENLIYAIEKRFRELAPSLEPYDSSWFWDGYCDKENSGIYYVKYLNSIAEKIDRNKLD